MSSPDLHTSGWDRARSVAAGLAETGVDPLDPAAARMARTLLVRRFVLDLIAVFAVAALAGAVALMVIRMLGGEDPLEGREIWLASGALVVLLVVVAARSFLAPAPAAYERAWETFLQEIWPGAGKGDELGAARLRFVEQAAQGGAGAFPSGAPGRKA